MELPSIVSLEDLIEDKQCVVVIKVDMAPVHVLALALASRQSRLS